ncbi:catalase family peroxidase [Nocardia sp. NPDC020380]|uniref:catalase family peroxidase n=1 Tax=Nocardia sp. NPDC020380 TaxID=3364309 RepID=UPI00379D13B4
MSEEPNPSRPRTPTLNRRSLLGATVVAAAGAVSIGGFLFTEDRLGPVRLTARRLVDGLQAASGRYPGYRRNHAKGVAVSGHFESNGAGVEFSKAVVFEAGTYPLAGRFSLAGGNPFTADTPDARRGLGLRIHLPGGAEWRLALLNIPVFTDTGPQDFYDRTAAYAPDPATGKPDAKRIRRYLDTHPKTVAALQTIRQAPAASGFANSTFHGLNAFECTASDGTTTPVRWRLEPEATNSASTGQGLDELFTGLSKDLKPGPLRWKLIVTLGDRSQDRTDDPTVAWPSSRRTVEVGTVVLTGLTTETAANVRDVNFDPLVLPDGLAASDDPVLQARSAAYVESYRRRAGETATRGPLRVEALG